MELQPDKGGDQEMWGVGWGGNWAYALYWEWHSTARKGSHGET